MRGSDAILCFVEANYWSRMPSRLGICIQARKLGVSSLEVCSMCQSPPSRVSQQTGIDRKKPVKSRKL